MEESRGTGCQRGVGMVEVLAALLVLAIGVLGYAGLQLRALKGATAAQTRVRAVMLARSALELMRVNPGRDYNALQIGTLERAQIGRAHV